MPQENVELVRGGYTAFAEQGVEGVVPFFTEDLVIYSMPEWPDDPEYHGHEGFRKLIAQWMENFDEFDITVHELCDAGNAVAARFELTGRIKGSPDPVAQEFAAVFSDFRHGRIGEQRLFLTWTEALETAGLRDQAVPQENVEIVRRSIEAWNRRDPASLLALWRADGEIDWSRGRGPLKGVYRGRAGIQTFMDEFLSTFEAVELEPEDLIEAGSEVVVPHTAHARGRDGIEVTARSAFVFTVEDGRITRLRMFQERDEALEAAGLPG